jgi:hypothetical protein
MSNEDTDTFVNFLFKPKVSFYIFLISLVVYLILLDDEGAFKNNFLKFGPDPNTKFLGMTMNTWEKVMLVYFISFFSSLLQTYSSTAMFNFIYLKMWNPAYKTKINMTKTWAQIITTIEPLLIWILRIIQFFCSMTMQLQFLIPQFLGHALTSVPYGLLKVDEKYKVIKSTS